MPPSSPEPRATEPSPAEPSPAEPSPAEPNPPEPSPDQLADGPPVWEAELYGAAFDPDTSPPDGEEVWLATLAAPVRDAYLDAAASSASPTVPDVLAAGFTHRDRGIHGAGFAAGGAGDTLAPGPVLASCTAEAWAEGLDHVGDDELVGVLCAWRRLASWAAAGESAAITELAHRRTALAGQTNDPRVAEHLDDEIAAALTLTGRSASRLVGIAAALARLPATAAALEAGVIDWPRAVVIADETSCLDDADAAVAESRIIGAAPGQTTGQLRAATRRAALAIDAAAATKRRQKAAKDARVETWTEIAGTAALAGRDLPAAHVIAADQRISALARWLKDNGAEGTLDQLRGKVFTALLTGQDPRAFIPSTTPGTVGIGTTSPGTTSPGTTSPGPGSPGPGATGPSPNSDRVSSIGSDQPGDAASPADAGWPASGIPGWPTGLCGSVNLTVPLATWLNLSGAAAEPGECAGLGPLDAPTSRDLAAALASRPESRWYLTIVGPDGRAMAHGCARAGPGPPGSDPYPWLADIRLRKLETGTCTHPREVRGYRPPPSLRHLISIRDRTCAYPTCRRRASRCDDDHTIPFDKGGKTCECNLAPLCRRHHRAKQAPGWQLSQPEPGTLAWTLPSGRAYVTTPGRYPC